MTYTHYLWMISYRPNLSADLKFIFSLPKESANGSFDNQR